MRFVGATANYEYAEFSEADLATPSSEFLVGTEATSDPFLLRLFIDAAANYLLPIEHIQLGDLGEAGYRVRQPIPVEIKRADVGDYEAWFREANIAIAGTDSRDALQALVTEILDTYDVLLAEPALGPDAVEQLRILSTYIGRT